MTTPGTQKPCRILVAEDQPEVAGTLTRVLQRWGHAVVLEVNGAAALHTITERGNEFDLCITDLNMPEASGLEVIRRIRASGLPMKVALMGGYLTPHAHHCVDELKIDAVLTKPFSMADIAAALRTCGL